MLKYNFTLKFRLFFVFYVSYITKRKYRTFVNIKTMKLENPFLTTGYLAEKYFCNRKTETDKLLSAINNSRNVTLYSLRRMGKTGLIHHTLNYLRKNKDISLIYCDIYLTQDLSDFVKVFSNAVLRSLESKPEKFFKKALEIFKNIKPKVTADQFTGEPSIEFSVYKNENITPTLNELFSYLKMKSKNTKIVIAIDEFQQIVNYPEKNVEAILRTEIQSLNNACFIFSGSKKHLMQSVFMDSGRPFYQSTEMMNLNKINDAEYISFILLKFRENKIQIEESIVKRIIEFTNTYTYYVQYLCNKLFSNYKIKIEEHSLRVTIEMILKENEDVFLEYKNLISQQQWNLLKAIAKEKGIKSVTSMEFIKKHGLTAPSTINNSIRSLLEKELIYFEGGKYYVYDLFFSRWLERI